MAHSSNPAAGQSRSPVPAAVDRYFQGSLFLLVVTGFATLAGTGRLDLPSVVAVSTALMARAYLLLTNRTAVIPERWTSLATLVYVLFYTADLFLVSGSYVSASIHLVLFGTVVKLFSVQRDRDHLYLAVLSFLAVLSASMLTVDSLFLVSFCAFLLLAVTTFVSMEMRRSAAAADTAVPIPGPPISRALSLTSVLLASGILAGAVAMFFVLPRLSAGYLSAYAPRNELISGFSDSVQLGEIGRIKQSSTVVMHVDVENDTPAPGVLDLKWRGIALAHFDGRTWSKPATNSELLHSSDGRFELWRRQLEIRNSVPAPAGEQGLHPLRYRIVMEPIGTNVIFLAPVPASLASRIREIGIDENGAVFNLDHSRMTESYQATSLLPAASPTKLSIQSESPQGAGNSAQALPPELAANYLELPKVDVRIRALAERVTAGAFSDYDKAVALELYLKRNYGYSLEMAVTSPPEPLVYFLFQRKEGHCEYFASAMAVMLRTLGIPARLVNGFRTGEYNDITGSYIIRARDAHSWVEAYIPGYGWMSFDPTPPDPKPSESAWNRLLLYLDAGREFWREWVINYDVFHQRTLTSNAGLRARIIVDRLRLWTRRQHAAMLDQARQAQQRVFESPLKWIGFATGTLALVLLLLSTPRISRRWRKLRLAQHPGRAPQAAASIWYARMTRALARRGITRMPVQTPAEFVAAIPQPQLRRSVARFTHHYERARFGESVEDAERLPDLYEEVDNAP